MAPTSALEDGLRAYYDVVYGRAGDETLRVDIFRPEPAEKVALKPLPAVLFVHGGGWVGGNKNNLRSMAKALAKQGYVTFCPSYRLVTRPQNQWPAPLDDVQRCVRWVRANAATYGLDPKRVGALGASAGGHLVALLGTRDTRNNSAPELAGYSSRVRCVVDLFGPTDLTSLYPNKPLNVPNLILTLMGKTPAEAPQLFRDASPIKQINARTVPFLIFHGEDDPIVPLEQSQRFHAALQGAGIESTLVTFPGEGHGFAKKANQERFAAQSVAFFNRHLRDAK
ncbi:MAG: hypothetical protein JWN98_1402 [Abditibacteriota bacterium]|nr:hypothetical protein [Abditibacteriota bacterium]